MGRRTPLMRAMRELAEVHSSLPEDRSLSFDEAIDLHRGLVTRRQVLKGAGVLGAAAAIAGPPLARTASPALGAYKLQLNGIHADLYESRDRVGGRCWSARTFADGQVAEHGGEFVDTRHVELRRLVAALGLQLDDLWPAYAAEHGAHELLMLDGAVQDRHVVREHFDVVIRRLVRDAKNVGPYRWGETGLRAAREVRQAAGRRVRPIVEVAR